jgi:hypothetical protein
VKRIISTVLCIAAIVLGAGCSRTVQFELPKGEVLKLLVYSDGRPRAERELIPSSKEYGQLSLWLQANSKGWSPTPASYVPGVYVSGKAFSINFLKASIIINYSGGQYTKRVDPKEYEFLLQ